MKQNIKKIDKIVNYALMLKLKNLQNIQVISSSSQSRLTNVILYKLLIMRLLQYLEYYLDNNNSIF